MKNLAIIGAGSWGTALAIVLAPRFARVRLWVYEADLAARMGATRENDVYLPGFQIPTNVEISYRPGRPPWRARSGSQRHALPPGARLVPADAAVSHESMVFVSATKGLENGTLLRMSEVIREVLAGPL